MSEVAALPNSAPAIEATPRRLFAGVALVSFSSLLLELALTRLFSVVLFYHFAFLAISIALLGLGAGGVFAYVSRAWLAKWDLHRLGAAICLGSALAILAVLEVVLHVPVSLNLEWANFGRLTVIYLAASVPFFLTGLLFSIVFARRSGHIAQLYGADLAGGALSCLAIVPLLNWLGGPNAVLFAALTMAVAAAVWAAGPARRKLAIALALVLAALLAANHSGKLIDVVYAKGMRRDQPWMLFAKWNAISRVEVNQQGEAKYIVIDADASTAIMNIDPYAPEAAARARLMSAAAALVNLLRPQSKYAIIGPGGGVDVMRALVGGSRDVTGIEINPIIVNDVMRGRYADYVYHLYDLPEVRIHVSDGRSWIRNSPEQFDVIQMTLVDTWASTAAGALALSENNLYTVEAFREYFDHLKPGGMIAITRWEFRQPREALRVVSQAMEALRQIDGHISRHHNFMVISEGSLDEDGRAVTVLAKRSAFTAQEQALVRAYVATHGQLVPLYMPAAQSGIANRPPQAASHTAFRDLVTSDHPQSFAAAYPYNVGPASDDAPFFFFTFKTGQALRAALSGTGTGVDWKNNLGIIVLGMLLVISMAAVVVFLILPLLIYQCARRPRISPLAYFIALGLGYIMVEIALIQRFVLFLGHPTYALTVVVFLMLLSSGAGSVVSRRWLVRTLSVRWVLALIVAAVVAYIWLLPILLRSLVGLPFFAKAVVSGALIAPLGFAMGMPFPTGLRRMTETLPATSLSNPAGESTIEWAWAMNAASSVLGSVLAMVIAIHVGLKVALACAAAAYLLAAALTLQWRTRHA
jgi:spermidine synthase